jgi:hypothetical protein
MANLANSSSAVADLLTPDHYFEGLYPAADGTEREREREREWRGWGFCQSILSLIDVYPISTSYFNLS